MSTRAIILAAGKGTRMKCDLPKVLHTVAGRSILDWVVDAALGAGVADVTVVVGHGADAVTAALPDGVVAVAQDQQRGTGHAVATALAAMGDVSGDTLLVLPGDSPLFRPETIAALLAAHSGSCTVLTTTMPDPTGYGRIVRVEGAVGAIVEERDADETVRAITEVAVSTYVFDGAALPAALAGLTTRNEQREQYLTDVVAHFAATGPVGAFVAPDHRETLGVNSHDQLADAEAAMRERINHRLMEAGVWMQDPATTYVDATVEVDAGVRLYADVHLEGATRVAAGSVVGPGAFVLDSTIGPGATVWYSVVRGVTVGANADVGPFASLRPGTTLAAGAKAGTFVEVKASTIGPGSKVPHLSYIGDATIGEDSNVGAGTITCNYDGFRKHRTTIGSRVFIGSDTMLVAPVEIGDGAVTGAGSVITKDVSPGALAVERSPQKEIPGYADKRARLADSEGE
jgi:bifunctional UDP-N-acetylglucosamine pyrophosphorylase/glucosamine-1-phosphate N-acetyltransferase